MNARTAAAVVLAFAAGPGAIDPAAAGPYDQAYAIVEPANASATQDTRPAFILSVDGDTRSVKRKEPVAPGRHVVKASLPSPPGMSMTKQGEITLDMQPCTRYRLSAARSARTAQDWKVVVTETEPIRECEKKFGPVAR
jgi:hypothetical protein